MIFTHCWLNLNKLLVHTKKMMLLIIKSLLQQHNSENDWLTQSKNVFPKSIINSSNVSQGNDGAQLEMIEENGDPSCPLDTVESVEEECEKDAGSAR